MLKTINSRYLPVQIQQKKNQEKAWNLFKGNKVNHFVLVALLLT